MENYKNMNLDGQFNINFTEKSDVEKIPEHTLEEEKENISTKYDEEEIKKKKKENKSILTKEEMDELYSDNDNSAIYDNYYKTNKKNFGGIQPFDHLK